MLCPVVFLGGADEAERVAHPWPMGRQGTCAAVGVAGQREGPQGRGGGHAVRRWFVGYVTSVGPAILQEGVGVDTLLAAGWRGGLMTCLIHIANDRNSQLRRNEFAVMAK